MSKNNYPINLTDWLYRNNYGYIYDEWLKDLSDIEEWDFVKEKYPKIWEEYVKENESNDKSL